MPRLDDATTGRLDAISPRLAWALCWSQQFGFPVLPCDPATKGPLIEGGKLSATRDPDQIVAWWTDFPHAMIGGRTDGKVVLDFDAYKDGHREDCDSLGELPPTRSHVTPGKDGKRGRHLVYLDPDGLCRSTKIGSSIDVRAGTSRDYIILPPSTNAHGEAYAVTDWCPPALVPAWVRSAARSSPANEETAPGRPLPEPEEVPVRAPVAWIRSTGCDPVTRRSEHTYALIRRCREAGLTPAQALTLTEADETTRQRIRESKRDQPGWWPREFWSCWDGPDHPAARPGRPGIPRIHIPPSSRKEDMNDDQEEPGKEEKLSGAQTLLRIARQQYAFGVTTDRQPFAVARTGPKLVHLYRGSKTGLRSLLSGEFERQLGRPPTQNALSEALQTPEVSHF